MQINQKSIVFLAIPLILSAFTHLWNPVGFPDLFYDEGIYMYRTMHVLSGEGLQTGSFYDHPFFGQMFLAGVLSMIGFPNSLHPTPDTNSVKMFYLLPRVLMGIIAVIDTFLIYKISQRCYSKNVALLASVLFAVMPITWFVRRILLDSILLPFLLSSILFALYVKDSKNEKSIVLISGIFLGITLFTKETMFTLIPLVAVVIYRNTRNRKLLLLWFLPVLLIPLAWPIQSMESNQIHKWIADVLVQVHRQNNNFLNILQNFFYFDPLLLLLGIAGTIYAAIRRDLIILLWVCPFVIFLISVGYLQYFYWIPLLPVFSIGASKLVMVLSELAKEKVRPIIPFVLIVCLGIFGLTMSALLITSNVSGQYDAAAFIIQKIQDNNKSLGNENITIISSPVYSWLFHYVYKIPNVLPDYRYPLFHPLPTDKVFLIADPHFKSNINAGKKLQDLYNNTRTIKKFEGGVLDYGLKQYPFTSMTANYEGSEIEIRQSK
jgi:hypothetical protein